MTRSFPMPDCQPGDTIRLVKMGADPCPIPPGATGTVRSVVGWGDGEVQVHVKWDIHRSLSLCWPLDKFDVIARPRSTFFSGDANGLGR